MRNFHTSSFQSAPLVASSPHLLNANAGKVAMVEGLHPDPEGHVTKLNIEPNTGLLIAANKRIQYNVLVDRVPRQVGARLLKTCGAWRVKTDIYL